MAAVDDVVAAAARIRDRIAAAGGDPAAIRLLAVTKGHGADVVRAAAAAGLVDVGESYARELLGKAEELDGQVALRWHFIGQLQRNKVRALALRVHLWQSVDRVALGAEVARRAPGAAVLAQVNLTDDPRRGGCPPADAPELVAHLRDLGLDVRGLMAVAARGGPDVARAGFRTVRALADRLELPERSMGMTGDLELAVQEGTTMVRIGTALFGTRAHVKRDGVEN